jgi:uncharacterized membrane protein YphA (DoxX/SURF4 family)
MPLPDRSTPLTVVLWLCQLVAAGVMLQTLFFKFRGAEESIYIFSKLGVEPWGRWMTGSFELIAVILLLIPKTAGLGALLGLGLMSGAILSHLGPLGINVKDDGGLLFGLACIVFVTSAAVAWVRRHEILALAAAARQLF